MAKINIFDNYLKDEAYLFIKPVVELGIFTFMNSADGKINHTYEYQVVNLGVPYRDGNIKQMMGTQDRTWSWDGYLTSTTAMTAHEQMEAIEMLLKNGLPVSLVYLGHCWSVVIKSFTANIIRECRVDYSITVEEYIPTYMQYKPAKIIPIIPPEYGIIPPPPGGGGGGIPINPNDPCVDQPCSEFHFRCDTSNPILYSGKIFSVKKGTTSGVPIDTNELVNAWIDITKERYHDATGKEMSIHPNWIEKLKWLIDTVCYILHLSLVKGLKDWIKDLIKAGKVSADEEDNLVHCVTYLTGACLDKVWYRELGSYMTTPCVKVNLEPANVIPKLPFPHIFEPIFEAYGKGYIIKEKIWDYLKVSPTLYQKLEVQILRPNIELPEKCIQWCQAGGWQGA